MELHPTPPTARAGAATARWSRTGPSERPSTSSPGTYDAVVMYELLEHVPDVDALLAAAEEMLKPGGLVYLSTPAGTFGQGQNPHHLRALRPVELADICRRRGAISDMEVGSDGIATASYTPVERRGEIAIFTGPSWMKWAPFDIELKGLGGSETAAVRLGEALAQEGYVVTVYGECEESCFADVVFKPWQAFDPAERRLGVIASRIPAVYERPVNAQFKGLWVHDIDCGDSLSERFASQIDRVLALSEWHERHLRGRYPFVADKVTRVRNGIHLEYFQDGESDSREQRVVYTSSPDRGPRHPARAVAGDPGQGPGRRASLGLQPVYFEIAKQDPVVAAHAEKVRELSKQDGVTALGSLSQPEIANLMRSSGLGSPELEHARTSSPSTRRAASGRWRPRPPAASSSPPAGAPCPRPSRWERS
jgi:SAM-dependent methyltransferase